MLALASASLSNPFTPRDQIWQREHPAAEVGTTTIRETHQNLRHWQKLDRVPALATHEIVFSVKQANLDKLDRELTARSTPGNAKYGQHMKFDDVDTLIATRDPASRVLAWAKRFMPSHEVKKMTPRGEYIRITAPVGELETAFDTTFSYYKSTATGKVAVRTDSVTVPKNIKSDLQAIFHTTDFPPLMKPTPTGTKVGPVAGRKLSEPTNSITPATLNSFYRVTSNTGSSSVSQGVFETGGQYYSPESLSLFQENFGLSTSYKVSTDVGGHASNTVCSSDPNTCTEANLDVQYMMAMSQGTPMTYYYESNEEDPFVAFAEALAAETSPPDVNSISYGSVESEISKSTMDAFNTEAMKLGTMGVSVFVSSGDDGVANYMVTSQSQCAYNPSYPATSPYVTAVGATYAASWDTPGQGEIVCQGNKGGTVTSGGGFSATFDAPSYQTSAISGYFDAVSKQPVSGYASGGRGYPDVALSGFGYEVVIGDYIYSVCGTSCSAPTVGGMVSLINAIRVEAGASTLGFLNPAIYAASESSGAFNDITSGENQCTADGAVCCTQGFKAAKGWDPTTGFGSVDFTSFKKLMTSDLDAAAVAAAEARLGAKAANAGLATPVATTPAPAPKLSATTTNSSPTLGAAAPSGSSSGGNGLSTPAVVGLTASGTAVVGVALALLYKRRASRTAASLEEGAPALSYSALTAPNVA